MYPKTMVPDDLKDHFIGHESIPGGRKAPGPTRTTACPYGETNQRKPYMPVEDTSTPTLEDGLSFRQRL